eukprot:TRINITY_DN13669_c0_g1_i2.p1 TRINITY_DN13669_c0_g1~~TRINITY_DN13669_c0_g1_i2.p1  ORF type:complete len:114 (+),score=25.32 TRINITY_DN13669_c0_g1_i2:77-418(+)
MASLVTPPRLAFVSGLALLCHAAVATISHRELLELAMEPFSLPPQQALIEIILGFILCLYASVEVFGILQPIKIEHDNNLAVLLPEATDFISFHHRRPPLVETLNLKFSAKNL